MKVVNNLLVGPGNLHSSDPGLADPGGFDYYRLGEGGRYRGGDRSGPA